MTWKCSFLFSSIRDKFVRSALIAQYSMRENIKIDEFAIRFEYLNYDKNFIFFDLSSDCVRRLLANYQPSVSYE